MDDIPTRSGKLTPIRRVPGPNNPWLCRCDCGGEKVVRRTHLTQGLVKSCGCVRERHGLCEHGTYNVWKNMRKRCLNPTDPSYKNYGGRGITVSPRWDKFTVFLADVGPRPSPKHSIDRIDNSRGYEPGNVRWATRGVQNRNKRSNNYITFAGDRLCLADWAARLGINEVTLLERMEKWPLARALTEPAHRKGSRCKAAPLDGSVQD